MTALRILLLSDGRPGHYHLAEGVCAALQRLRPVEVVTVAIKRRLPTRVLMGALRAGVCRASVGTALGLWPRDAVTRRPQIS